MSVRLRSTKKINWGGWNPFIDNYLEIEMKEISKSSTGRVFQIKDWVKEEMTFIGENNELMTYERDMIFIREKNFPVSDQMYNNLYSLAESQLPPNLTPFEKDELLPKMAFLLYFTNDFLKDENDATIVNQNGDKMCLYMTLSNEWEILNK